MRNSIRIILGLLFLLVVSCAKKESDVVIRPQRHWVSGTVAVVAPIGDAATKTRLERTAAWFLENFKEAQLHDTLAINLEIEWYDELSDDLSKLSTTLSRREDILAIVGPFSNESVEVFAAACRKTQKPLIAPTATSEEIIRRYAVTTGGLNTNDSPFLWSLTETDVRLTGFLMSSFATTSKYNERSIGRPQAALFSPSDVYGRTFNYWAPFYAGQDDIDLRRNLQYGSTEELLTQLDEYRKVMEDQPTMMSSAILCVTETARQIYEVARSNRKALIESSPIWEAILPSTDPDDVANDIAWQLFRSTYNTWFAYPNMCEEVLEELGTRAVGILQGYEGFSPYADPTTGFELSYETRFGVKPTFAECKFYDALMLAAFAACYVEHYPDSRQDDANRAFNDAIIALTVEADDASIGGPVWNATPMEVYLSALEQGHLLHLVGASGEIDFDSDTFTAATSTTYVQWLIMEGKIQHRYYFGGTGGRVADSKAAWRYLYDEQQASVDFDVQAEGSAEIHYPALTDQYAVLVQGSEGYINYRHQADVLSVYQALRRGGFPDDHIILILDSALMNNPLNPEPGVIRTAMDSPDLLSGTDMLPAAVVDYNSADLTSADIADILLGNGSERLKTTLPQDEGANVLFYWSGHGRSTFHGGANEFCWRKTSYGNGFTAGMLRETASQMKFRKLLIAAEPCYSECVIRSIEGVDGVLALSGANSEEQSWADNWSDEASVWMCDRFSQNLVNCLTDNPQTSFRDLFLYCARHTLGSHAQIVNAANFGNLYVTGPAEFIIYDK